MDKLVKILTFKSTGILDISNRSLLDNVSDKKPLDGLVLRKVLNSTYILASMLNKLQIFLKLNKTKMTVLIVMLNEIKTNGLVDYQHNCH